MGYWEERQAEIQAALTQKSIAQTEAQIAKYYADTQLSVIAQFERTYNHILAAIEDGRQPTPADLYKLDTYWQMQAQIAAELEALGKEQAKLLSKAFINQYQNIYRAIALPSDMGFNKIDTKAVEAMINGIWCADGKNWSSRVWENTAQLQETLNQNLIDCLVTGRNPDYLRATLMETFGVSYNKADMLVRTEMAHIQNKAAQDRYAAAGCSYYEVWADKDERQCKECGKLHKKRYKIGIAAPVPAHPRCRCSIIPVIDDYDIHEETNFKKLPFRG